MRCFAHLVPGAPTMPPPRLVPLALLGILLPVVPAGNLHAQGTDETRVRAVVEALAEHVQAGRVEALDTLYAEGRGVHIIEGAGVNHGWTDYRDHHLVPELEAFDNLRYRYHSVEPVVRGDVAWASFRYDLAVDTEDGHVEMEGRGTAVLERRNGSWRVVHLHTSGRPVNPS